MTAVLKAWHGQNLSPHPEEPPSGPAFGRPKDKLHGVSRDASGGS